MSVGISEYNFLCNLGNSADSVFQKAMSGVDSAFQTSEDIILNTKTRLGLINCDLEEIKDPDFDLRCNKLILKCLKPLNIEALIKKYGAENISIVVATTNSGSNEYISSKNKNHAKLSNPAEFIKNYYGLKNYFTTVSSACSSGIKALSLAVELIESDYSKASIVVGVDPISKVPVFGFHSLEILSSEKALPFSKNRNGINISEGVAAFILEKENIKFKIAGISETTDCYHPTTPEPTGTEAKRAINIALLKAQLKPSDIDYINLHGTGTIANDLMEANAIFDIFKDNVLVSSTKPLTGHALGAASSIETALCLKLLETNSKDVFKHIFDNEYDETIPKLKLAQGERAAKMENILCTSFGFGGANAALVLKKKHKLTDVLPHNYPMILIDDIINYDDKNQTLSATFDVYPEKLFFEKSLDGINSLTGLEMMAQTIGCYSYFRNNYKKSEAGLLLGTRLFNNAIDVFKNGESYKVIVKEAFTDDKISSFECIIKDKNDDEIQSATINVCQLVSLDELEEMTKYENK